MNKELSETQKHLLEIFAWFNDFCRANSLCYYCVGGTMLGVARHGGFIPWDDDIDVAMPREDYEKLARLCVHNSSPFILETPHSENGDYLYAFSKLYDSRTTCVEQKRIPVKRGLFIDIFPIDGAGSSEKEARKIYIRVNIRHKLFLLSTLGNRKGRSKWKNAVVTLAKLIPFSSDKLKNRREALDRFAARYSIKNCSYGGYFLGGGGMNDIMPLSVYGEPEEYDFENIKVFGVGNPDEYLTRLYGDWKKLPPESERHAKHEFSEFDLNKPYMQK